MKVQKQYVCEFCGRPFKSEPEAEAHEKKHEVPKGIEMSFYQNLPWMKEGNEAPTLITIEMESGRRVMYQRRDLKENIENTQVVIGEVK